jgi:hypothetical protein
MSDMSGPPFRADHVGSLLRPPELLRARAEHQAEREPRSTISTTTSRFDFADGESVTPLHHSK